jgi:oxaloacetate decarboxylase alpha subunit
MAKKIEFWETALRDAHQSLWATRMTQEMIEDILPNMDATGYKYMPILGAAGFESNVYYLAEDPWERMDMIHRGAPNTTKCVWVRSLNMLGWEIFSDDVFDLTIDVLSRHGLGASAVMDANNDTRNMVPGIEASKKAGMKAFAAFVFSVSPVHTDEYYVERVKEAVEFDVDGIIIKDSGALLTPDRVRTLTPAFREAMAPDLELHFHTHCTSGLGPLCAIEALDYDIDVMHAAITPLAHGNSNPPLEMVAREAVNKGFEVGLDFERLEHTAEHFRQQAIRYGKPLGQPKAYDPGLYRHQVPGGMRSNLEAQLETLGLSDILPAVLEEITRIREELGWPIQVSPLSQYCGVQALFNVVEGERYRTVQTELKKYATGWYGRTPAPIDPDIQDRLSEGDPVITDRPGSLIEPMVEKCRKERGPFATDEDLVLALHFKPKVLDDWHAARAARAQETTANTPVAHLVKELSARPEVSYFFFEKDGTRVSHAM